MLIAKRWILALLRHRTFYSLAELNGAIVQLLERLKQPPAAQAQQSRRELFERFDLPNALSLPDKPYQYAEWKLATVNIDYHIEVDKHFYSVPYKLIHDKLDVRLTAQYPRSFPNERVAAHVRSFVAYHHTTLKEHMPPDHQNYLEWTPSRIIDWAKKTGPAPSR